MNWSELNEKELLEYFLHKRGHTLDEPIAEYKLSYLLKLCFEYVNFLDNVNNAN